jgi:glycosyltransferase involved in cell wall biosynthesis
MAGRKQWLKRAVECFKAQTYANAELLIIPDTWEDVELLESGGFAGAISIPARQQNIGAKRNFGCECADSDLIAIWDDDDYSAPGRLAQQVKEIEITGKAVTGYRMMKFTDGSDWWQYRIGEGFVIGSSLMFKRSWWQQHPFPEIQIGEDAAFCQAAHDANQLAAVPDLNLMYCSIHDGNTSKRDLTRPDYRPLPGFKWTTSADTETGTALRGVCGACGCTDEAPCFDEMTGEPCAWAGSERDLCTFCAECGETRREPLIIPCGEYEAQRYIEARRAPGKMEP